MDVVIDRCENGFVVHYRLGDRRVYYPNLESVLCAVHDAFDPPRAVHYSAARNAQETSRPRDEPLRHDMILRHRPIGEAA